MTVKEFNRFKIDVYNAAMQNEEIAQAVNLEGEAYIYEARDFQNHKFFVLTRPTQMHNRRLRENGFDPDKTTVTKVITISSHKTVLFG